MILRACTPLDYKILYAWRKEPTTQLYNPLDDITELENNQRLEKEGSELSDGTQSGYRWIVEVEGQPVGNVCLKNINRRMGYAEIGYGIAEKMQGKKLGTEAVRMLVSKIFDESELRRLVAYVSVKNIASCRLLERLKFTREGLLRQHYIINGAYHDECLYAILREEWKA